MTSTPAPTRRVIELDWRVTTDYRCSFDPDAVRELISGSSELSSVAVEGLKSIIDDLEAGRDVPDGDLGQLYEDLTNIAGSWLARYETAEHRNEPTGDADVNGARGKTIKSVQIG